jgi:branched-chain amino acid aminotransferase
MSMADRDGFIWHDGKLVPWREATTRNAFAALWAAVFEGLRAYKTTSGTAIFRLREHIERLFNSAHTMMKMPYDKRLSSPRNAKWFAPTTWSPATFGQSLSMARKMGVSRRRAGALSIAGLVVLSWCRWTRERNSRQDLLFRPASHQRHDVSCEVFGDLRELHPGQSGGGRPRLHGVAARRGWLRGRGPAESLPGQNGRLTNPG